MKAKNVSRITLVFLVLMLLISARPVGADPVFPPESERWPYPPAPPLEPPSPQRRAMQITSVPIITDPILDMKVLVVHRTGDAGIYAMISGYLDILGIPYDTLLADSALPAGTLDANDLWDGDHHGYYYALFFSSSAAWANIHADDKVDIETYEAAFDVRRVTWYAYPNVTDHGLNFVQVVAGYNDPACPGTPQGIPFDTTFTSTGVTTFSYLHPTLTLTIDGPCIYGYLAEPDAGADVTPLLEDGSGNTILSIFQAPEGREHMVMTVSSYYPSIPPAYLHARTLPYGMINWATKGVFLGERRVYFAPQPDDVLAWGDRWDVDTHWYIYDTGYRLEPNDVENIVTWANAFGSSEPNASTYRIEMPFNGEGSQEDLDLGGDIISGTLTAKVVELEDEFTWLNHTYTHQDLDGVSYTVAYNEIALNNAHAAFLGLTDYTTRTLLTGAYSGLTNPNVAQAAYDLGVRYMLVDASRSGYNNPTPNTGIPHPNQPEILQVPRNATNIFYAVTTPEEETDLYNFIYCPGYSTDPEGTPPCYTYEEVIELVTNQALGFMLDFNINATMFHMNNINDYGNGQTLLGDFSEALYGKYNALYTDDVPVLTLRTQEIGEAMWSRMEYNDSGAAGQIMCGDGLTVTTVSSATVPLTGIDHGSDVDTYAGQSISYLTMGANDSEVIPGDPPQVPAVVEGLYLTTSGPDAVLHWDATTQDTEGSPISALVYRVYARANDHYFTPTDADLLDEVTDLTYIHANGIADPETVYTYVVVAVGDNCWKRESDLSLRVSVKNPNAVSILRLEVSPNNLRATWIFVGISAVVALVVKRRGQRRHLRR